MVCSSHGAIAPVTMCRAQVVIMPASPLMLSLLLYINAPSFHSNIHIPLSMAINSSRFLLSLSRASCRFFSSAKAFSASSSSACAFLSRYSASRRFCSSLILASISLRNSTSLRACSSPILLSVSFPISSKRFSSFGLGIRTVPNQIPRLIKTIPPKMQKNLLIPEILGTFTSFISRPPPIMPMNMRRPPKTNAAVSNSMGQEDMAFIISFSYCSPVGTGPNKLLSRFNYFLLL